MTHDAPRRRRKLIGPGEAVLRLGRVFFRFARRRPLLFAWLSMMIAALVLPCLFYYEYMSPSSRVYWGIGHGGIVRLDGSLYRYQSPSSRRLWWGFGARGLYTFNFEWSQNGQPANHPPHLVKFPVWIVPAVPTLLIGTPLLVRGHRRRRRAREAVRAGRTPCPACGYDVTGLEICPECGAGNRRA